VNTQKRFQNQCHWKKQDKIISEISKTPPYWRVI